MDQPQQLTLITGALSEIGEGVARRIAVAQRTILQDDDRERLAALRQSLTHPESHLIWPQDLNRNAEIPEKLSALIGEVGVGVSSFVHCAEEVRRDTTPPNSASVCTAFEINYFSAAAIIRVLCKKTVNQAALRNIVFVSHIASRFGIGGFSTYAATKGALDSLARSLAVELAPTVRVNSVLAGNQRSDGEKQLGYLLGSGEPGDIAGVCTYLLSDDARWITGQQIIVDGGKTSH